MTRLVTPPNFAPPAIDPDLGSIRPGTWPQRPFPLGQREAGAGGGATGRRAVLFRQSVLNDVYAHGRATPDIEVCGVLVGNVYQDEVGPYVFVEASIRGNYSAGRAAQVTFTAKTWSHIQDVMERHFPDLRVIGWYHTHPGHGIFLSEMDLFIQKNFFSLPWHLALVFDPQHQEEGLFTWHGGNMAVAAFGVLRDAPAAEPKVARRIPEQHEPQTRVEAPQHYERDAADDEAAAALAQPRASASATAELEDLSFRVHHLERRQRWMTAALAVLVLVAVAWPIALAALSVLRTPDEALPQWLTPTTAPAGEKDQ
jgi:proteasome lid subunit RPN8/RPN11